MRLEVVHPEDDPRHLDGVLCARPGGHRAHERLVAVAHMRIDHFKVTFIHRQIDGFTDCAARMMHMRRHISEFYEILEIFNRAIATTIVEIMHERRTIDRREDGVLATNLNATCGVAGMLRVMRRNCCDELLCKTAWETHAFALDVASRVFQEFQRIWIITKFNADFFKQCFSIMLDDLHRFLRKEFDERALARNIGNRGSAA